MLGGVTNYFLNAVPLPSNRLHGSRIQIPSSQVFLFSPENANKKTGLQVKDIIVLLWSSAELVSRPFVSELLLVFSNYEFMDGINK